ncbi:hypothetical protein PRIPAC_77856 [Pristionchus pacificus]|uniref:Reverse transcriptase domain-containing protein n=1 Tax=Pristionchus pacificus TaxID=54126 RepID=A0A2A6CAU0_PRIPA|nr:hypothetical protein PRIPAC_77856 [Pristionchus pacificus]|eukprot:PDM75249.1 hypothetical protein PRIPAC_43443 [Pristionchus pacificus]
MASLKRPPHLSPSSFRDETESAAIPDPTNILRGIAKYLDALSPEDKSSPLALLLGTCAMQINDLMARSTMSIEDAIEKEKRDRSVVVMGLTESATTALPELATHSLSCQYYNIRSIVNKLDSFRTFLMSSQPDIVFLTETWLSAKIPSSLIIGSLPYTVIRFDRSSRGGGVCILLRDYLSYSTVSLPSSDHEITCIDLFHSYAYIRLCLVYRPPSYSLPKTESLISCLSDIHASSPHPIIITGDFNSDSLCTLPNPIDRVFRDFILSADLSHLNVTPTRGSKCIDWVLGNDPSLIPCISIIPPFPSCDHSGLSFSINSPQSPSLPSKIRDFSRADFSALSSHLHSIDWFSLFRDCPDIESVYTNFTSTIHSAIDTFVPYRTPRPPTLSYPPHIIRLILHQDALFAKIHFPNLSRVKDLYRHVSSLTKPKLSIPELLSPMNVPVYDSLSKANLLATEFASHFTLDDGCLPPLSSSPIPPSLALFTFFPHEVSKSLRSVLGPILFSIYLSDLSRVLSKFHNVTVQCYADDVKLYVSYNKSTKASITAEFQSALDCLFTWAQYNQLSLSASKCSHIRIGSKQLFPRYQIDSIVLPLENNVRDLGVQVRSDLKSSSSIKIRAQKATSKMFLLLKALPFNCPSILIRSYKAYVLPLLDFASPFWNPHYSIDIATLEKVQHIFTRQVFYRCFPSPDYPLSLPSYPDRLRILGLRALTERRVIGDLCMTHLIMSGNTIIPRSLFYVYKPQRDRTSSFGIHKELTTSTPRYHSFPLRTARWYSQLPVTIRTAPNIRVFKRRLAAHPIIAHLSQLP